MHRSLISAAVVALLGLSAPAFIPAAQAAPAAIQQTTTQLPRNAYPLHYDVAIVPNAAASTFAGKVKITVDVVQPTSTLTLNAADMTFQSVSLSGEHGKGEALSGKASVDAAAQTATFTFEHALAKGRYVLALDYTGVIGTQAVGLFSLDYDTTEGHKRALYTQFENSDARRLIPSWDEPAYKATFELEATVPSSEIAVSNTPAVKKTDLPDGRSVIKFAKTPKMSTYLLFFALGDFERATTSSDGTELGVIAQKGKLSQVQFALDSSKNILREYNDYFGVRFPLPKLDNIAAPGRSQFFGAMENWGAIFTFEYAMLLDPSISTQRDKQGIFETDAHEMAHQWFGDLVTMKWWDDLWLNEGFATWMEGRTTERLHPEWHTELDAINGNQAAMSRDSLATTHPVVQHVETVEQASQAFDAITYQKGKAVISMLESYVGADAWRAGVRSYMKAHAYGNTTSDDFWREIEKAAHKPVMAIAHDFTLQPGVPMIRVENAVCDAGQTKVMLTQGEFSRDQPNKKALRWQVPVIAQTLGSSEQARTVVTGGKTVLSVPGCGPLLVNVGQSGYYRTVYAPKNFSALAADFGKLAPIDQLGLLADSWALGLNGQQPLSNFLELAKATPLEADPQVWGRIAGSYGAIHSYYRGDTERQITFDAYAISRLTPVMNNIGWVSKAGEADAVAILRESLIGTLSQLGDAGVIAEAQRRYAASLAGDASAVPAALRKVILRVVALHADAAAWDALHAAALSEKTPLVKDRLYDMLASTEDEALAKRALDLALTEEPGATNSAGMITSVAMAHPDLAFDFAVAHVAQVNERVDATSRSRYFPRVATGSSDPAMIAKLKAYADANLAPTARRDVETAIADITFRIKVRSERLPAIDAWLKGNAG
ncbi:MAG: M1 family metallopeptidase [Burkholderiaceae bacterium]|nr:M1 family metallopeptidase [Burkholderiaceae bacterium]